MSKFCGECATKLVDGACPTCTAKSTSNGLSMESLEKSLDTLEALSKGVRPAEAKGGEKDQSQGKEHNKKAVEQTHKYGQKGEGESEEQPKTKRGIESAVKGMPPVDPREEEIDPREEEEREREEEEEGGEPEFKSAKGKKAKKSFADEAMEYEGVRKAVDVSPFLEGITAQIGEAIDEVRSDVYKSMAFNTYQRDFNIGLASALAELGNIVKSLTEQVELIGAAPAGARKSDTSVAAIEKSFANGEAKGEQKLTKSQIASKLADLMANGDTSIQELDVLRAESTGAVRPELLEKLGLNKQ